MLERKSLTQSLNDIKLSAKLTMRLYKKDRYSNLNQPSITSAIIDILKQNDVPIIYLSNKILEQADHNKYILWRDEFKKVKDVLRNNNIEYVFIKTPSFFPYTSGNLDMLVREEDFAKVGKLLKKDDFVELKNMREPHKYLYKKFDLGKEIIPIHLHERIFWSSTFLNNESIWRNRPKEPFEDFVYTLPPEDCVLTTLAHSFYENAGVRLLDLSIVKYLVESKALNWDYLKAIAANYNWSDGFFCSLLIYEYLHKAIFEKELFPVRIIEETEAFVNRSLFLQIIASKVLKSKISMPFYIPLLLSKMLHYKKILKDRELGNKVLRLFHSGKCILEGICRNYLNISGHQKPMLITFSGIDGSGKTSYASALVKAFENCGLKTEYIWGRVGSTRSSQLASKVYKKVFKKYEYAPKFKNSDGRYTDFTRREKIFKKKWVSTLWHILNIFDFCVFYNLKVRKAILSGKVVICDRYILDIIADMYVHSSNKKPNLILKIFSALLPKPGTGIMLKVRPEVAYERAKEKEHIEYLHRQSNLYKQVQEPYLKEINSEGEFRDICNTLVKDVLEEYYYNR